MNLKVIRVSDLIIDGSESISGIKVENNTGADFKIIPMFVSDEIPISSRYGSAEIKFEKTVYVGHDSGKGCLDAVDEVFSKKGQRITYCYKAINSGSTKLVNLTLEDPIYIVDGNLKTAGNDLILEVGETAEYYYETISPIESQLTESVLNASIADEQGRAISQLEGVKVSSNSMVNVEASVAEEEIEPIVEPEIISEQQLPQSDVAGISSVDNQESVSENILAQTDIGTAPNELAFTGPNEIIALFTISAGLILLGISLAKSYEENRFVPQMVRVSHFSDL